MDKRGQGMPVNVIIIAVLALVILVVLAAIFAGRITIFEKGVSKEGRAELISLKVQYGDCRPTLAQEEGFTAQFDQATSSSAKDVAKDTYKAEINRCKLLSNDRGNCEAGGCKWS